MNEFLSSGQDITHNKYNRLVVITFFDTLLNLPILVVRLVLPRRAAPWILLKLSLCQLEERTRRRGWILSRIIAKLHPADTNERMGFPIHHFKCKVD